MCILIYFLVKKCVQISFPCNVGQKRDRLRSKKRGANKIQSTQISVPKVQKSSSYFYDRKEADVFNHQYLKEVV